MEINLCLILSFLAVRRTALLTMTAGFRILYGILRNVHKSTLCMSYTSEYYKRMFGYITK